MLEIRVIMDSPVEQIFGFKTCCGLKVFDQNLEIQIKNRGDLPVTVPSFFDLEGSGQTKRFEHLMPPGEHVIAGGDIMAFYCYMDESEWSTASRLVLYDREGTSYQVNISHQHK